MFILVEIGLIKEGFSRNNWSAKICGVACNPGTPRDDMPDLYKNRFDGIYRSVFRSLYPQPSRMKAFPDLFSMKVKGFEMIWQFFKRSSLFHPKKNLIEGAWL